MGGAVFPPCYFTWGQTMVEVMKIMVTSFKRPHAGTASLSAPDPAAGHQWPTPLPETPGHSRTSLGQSPTGSLLLSPGSWGIQGSVCALQDSVSPVLCKFWWLYDGVNGDLLQEGLCHTQIYCTQSPCPCGRPLLTHTFAGDIQTWFWLSLCVVSGSWWAQGLFEPSEHLWQVRGLILNAISPPYHLAGASHLPLDIACLFFVCGIQHFPVNGCSAVNCSFGVLTGEDERTSFYSAILCHKHRQRHT